MPVRISSRGRYAHGPVKPRIAPDDVSQQKRRQDRSGPDQEIAPECVDAADRDLWFDLRELGWREQRDGVAFGVFRAFAQFVQLLVCRSDPRAGFGCARWRPVFGSAPSRSARASKIRFAAKSRSAGLLQNRQHGIEVSRRGRFPPDSRRARAWSSGGLSRYRPAPTRRKQSWRPASARPVRAPRPCGSAGDAAWLACCASPPRDATVLRVTAT